MVQKPNIDHIAHRYAGVLIVTASGKIIGQKRDNKPGIDWPGKIGTFGGAIENGEDPKGAAWRELVQEETNLDININDLVMFTEDISWRELTQEWEERYFFIVRISDQQVEDMEVYEGEGWAHINGPDDPELIEQWRPIIEKLCNYISQAKN